MSPLPLLGLSLVRCELFCVYDGGRTHDLLNHNQALCQLSYIHHVVPIKGIEPNDIQDMSPDRKPFLSAFAEDIGIEPNTLTGTSRLAGGPYRHQGLSSVVLMTGYDPITSCVSDKCSTN